LPSLDLLLSRRWCGLGYATTLLPTWPRPHPQIS